MNRARSTFSSVLLAAALFFGATGSADAQPILGIRVSAGAGPGGTLSISVNELLTPGYPYTTAFIGVATFFFASPWAPAIEWGDGATVPFAGYGPFTGLPQTATNTFAGAAVKSYRGSFSHTYTTSGTYTVRVRSFQYATAAPLTGNPQLVPTYSGFANYQVITNTVTVPIPLVGLPAMDSLGLLALALLLGTAGWLQIRRAERPAAQG